MVHGGTIRLWSLGVSLLLLVLSYLVPSVLRRLNLIWFNFGLLLHRIVNPVVLGAMFFIVITPMAFFLRMLGKNLLQLKFDPEAKTYWIVRDPPAHRQNPSAVNSEVIHVFLAEIWAFARERKKFWLLPMLFMLVVFGGLLILAKGSAVAPFIYTVF